MTFASRFLRSIGPASPAATPVEALRAGMGALVGLGVAGVFILSPWVDTRLGLYLIAPFGASAVLLFAVPNSPLAQPWPALVGSIIAGVIGVAICLTIPDPALRIALAVGLSITAMVLCRAVHPPAGAVAMTAAMSPEAIAELGFRFVIAPVASGTLLLVVIAAIYARMTGRRYPIRQFDEPNAHGTVDRALTKRLDLSEDELIDILEKYRMSFNVGVEDLARLVGAAERQAATHRTGLLTVADIMSRDLITVSPETSGAEISRLFITHKFTSLPVVDPGEHYLGIIFQMSLISKSNDYDLGINSDTIGNKTRKRTRRRGEAIKASEIMEVSGPRATPETPISVLLGLMSGGDVDAVPILESDVLVGIVTRTDLIVAMAHRSLQSATP